jgi:hypothetical protein
MDKGYYKDPKTGEKVKGSFEDAWKSFIDKMKDEEGDVDSGVKNTFIKDKIEEVLTQRLEEKLCPRGQAYVKKRKDAGEKHSAYLMGRGVQVCKGRIKKK